MGLGLVAGVVADNWADPPLRWLARSMLVLGILTSAWVLARWVPPWVRWHLANRRPEYWLARVALALVMVALLLMAGLGVGSLALDRSGLGIGPEVFALGGLFAIAGASMRAVDPFARPEPLERGPTWLTAGRLEFLTGVIMLLSGLSTLFAAR